MFDIPENLDEPAVPAPRRSFRRSDASDSANGETNNDLEHEDIQINGTNGGSPAPMPIMDDNNDGDDDDDDDDDVVTNSFQHEQAELIPEESTPRTNHVDNENVDDVSTKKGRGRGRPSNVSLASIHDVPDTTFDTDEANANSAPKRKRGRPPKNSKPLVDTEPVEKPRKRTRLTFQQADAETRSDSGPVQESEVQALGEDGQGLEHNMVDEPGQEQEQEPEEEQQQEEHPEPVKPKTGKGTKSKKPPPSKKDPNAKMTSKSAKAAKLQDNDFKQPGVIKGVQRIREETPMEDEGALHTRSGRLSYKPLAHWKGEQALFEVGPGWGQTVQSLIRVEEVTPMKGAAGKSRGRPRKKHKTPVFRDAQHEVQDAEEPWEADEGIVTGPVRLWDPEIEQGVDEGAEQGEFAPFNAAFKTLLNTDAELYFIRNRICCITHPGTRRSRSKLSLRQDAHYALLRMWCCRTASWRVQASQKHTENANGLLRALRQGDGRGRWYALCHHKGRHVAGSQR